MMGDWGLLIQEGFLFDIGAYSVENAILEHGCCGCLFEGIFLFSFTLHQCRVFPLKTNIIIIIIIIIIANLMMQLILFIDIK